MTVRELIEVLKEQDPEMTVVVCDGHQGQCPELLLIVEDRNYAKDEQVFVI
jgi:hypothetical protein